MHLKLGELEVLSIRIFFKVFEKSKSRLVHIKSVSFWEPVIALNQISEHHHREVSVL